MHIPHFPPIPRHHAECLAGVLGQCPALADLDLICTAVGALVLRDVASKEVFVANGETLWKQGGAGVVAILTRGLMQSPCPWMAEINLSFNQIGPPGAESLAGVLGQCAALVKLDLHYNDIRTRGAESGSFFKPDRCCSSSQVQRSVQYGTNSPHAVNYIG